jgi:hypothetical protein
VIQSCALTKSSDIARTVSFWLIQKVQENTGGSLWKTNLFSIIALMRHSKIKLALFNITIPGLPSRLTLIGTL